MSAPHVVNASTIVRSLDDGRVEIEHQSHMGLTVLTFTAAEWQNIVAATKVRRRKRKPWPSCDCGRPRMDSLWQHDPGCAASVDFYRAYAEQQRLRRDDSA